MFIALAPGRFKSEELCFQNLRYISVLDTDGLLYLHIQICVLINKEKHTKYGRIIGFDVVVALLIVFFLILDFSSYLYCAIFVPVPSMTCTYLLYLTIFI